MGGAPAEAACARFGVRMGNNNDGGREGKRRLRQPARNRAGQWRRGGGGKTTSERPRTRESHVRRRSGRDGPVRALCT